MRVAVPAVAACVGLLLAGCGSSSTKTPKSSGTTAGNGAPPSTGAPAAQPAGTPIHGGTINVAEGPGEPPTSIFPFGTATTDSVSNGDVEDMLYRPLYWFGENDNPEVDYDKSVGQAPVWTNGDKSLSITLNDYTWSDGEKMDARDVLFDFDMIKFNKKLFEGYSPGYFPDNVTSVTMPKGPTGNVIVMNLTHSVAPEWFLYNELSQLTPFPIAWDRTSTSGAAPSASAAGLPDTTAGGAAAVFKYLSAQAMNIGNYTTSPLWTVIDGPWKLTEFSSQGRVTMVPNPAYTGTDHPYISKFVWVPYTSETPEYDDLTSGSKSIQVGYVPDEDYSQLSKVDSLGYVHFFPYEWEFAYTAVNYINPAHGAMFKQLYVRQALESLEDQEGWIKAYLDGLGGPQYGIVPTPPTNPFVDSYAKTNPFPFSVPAAIALLKAHGWNVKPNGTDTCATPSLCGPGIAKGAAMSFQALVSGGSTTTTEIWTNFKDECAQAGIQVNVKYESFDTVYSTTANGTKNWDFVGGDAWTFSPDYLPTGETLFTTGETGFSNGTYSDPTLDRLIQATTTSSSSSAFDAYQNFLVKNVPVLWQPNSPAIDAVQKGIGGTVLVGNAVGTLDPENWYYTKG